METVEKGRAKDYLKGIGFGVLMIVLFYAVQFGVEIPTIMVSTFIRIAKAGGDVESVMATYAQDIQSPEFLTIIMAIVTAATALVFGIWYKLLYARKFMQNGFARTKKYVLTGKNILVFFLLGVISYFVSLVISSVIALVSPDSIEQFAEMMGRVTGGSKLVTFAFTVILAPIGEECLFRGILQKQLMKWLPVLPALILQSLFFGIFHLNIVQGLYVLALGFVAGYAAYRCKSVLPAIFIHFVNNGISMIISNLPVTVLNNYLLWIVAPIVPLVLLVLVVKFMPGKLMEVPKEEE